MFLCILYEWRRIYQLLTSYILMYLWHSISYLQNKQEWVTIFILVSRGRSVPGNLAFKPVFPKCNDNSDVLQSNLHMVLLERYTNFKWFFRILWKLRHHICPKVLALDFHLKDFGFKTFRLTNWVTWHLNSHNTK